MANEFKVKKGLIVQGSGSAILDIQGDLGQLFSITDKLTGDLFTVSDISGIPILTANADVGAQSLHIKGRGHNGTWGNGCLVVEQDGGSQMWFDGNDIDVTGSYAGAPNTLYLQDYSKGLTVMGGSATVAGTMNIGPNVSSRYLNLGNANGSTTTTACVGVSNGNLHIDAANGAYATYLNFYDGTGGIIFGNGATGTNANVNSSGTYSGTGYSKTGSSDSYVLLGGGGHALLSGLGSGTVTSVIAGTGMTQTGTSTINPTLNVIGGIGITANANDIALSTDRRHTSLADCYTGASTQYTFYDVSAGIRWYYSDEKMRLTNAGALHVEDDITAYSTTVSDTRLKDNQIPITNALDKINALTGYTFTWNEGSRKGNTDIGVIAQEVETVLPEIVYEKEMVFFGEKKYKTVDYDKLTAVLIEGMKEQQKEIDELKSLVNQLIKK